MELRTFPDAAALATAAADLVVALVAERPDAHLCLAAGRTLRPLYAELVRRAGAGECSFAQVRCSQLDEWYGLAPDDPGTCAADLREHLLDPLGIPAEHRLEFDTAAPDPAAECARVAAALAAWGDFDLCLLGLGLNGHLGLNEPSEWLGAGTRVVSLSKSTQRHAMLAHLPQPPRQGLTLGLSDLQRASRVLLLVTGEAKREALAKLLAGPPSTRFPASLLHWHPACSVLADAAAAGEPVG